MDKGCRLMGVLQMILRQAQDERLLIGRPDLAIGMSASGMAGWLAKAIEVASQPRRRTTSLPPSPKYFTLCPDLLPPAASLLQDFL
jgi:hypothetical protein